MLYRPDSIENLIELIFALPSEKHIDDVVIADALRYHFDGHMWAATIQAVLTGEIKLSTLEGANKGISGISVERASLGRFLKGIATIGREKIKKANALKLAV